MSEEIYLVSLSLCDEPSRRLGEEEDKNPENGSRDDLEAEWDSPLSVVM